MSTTDELKSLYSRQVEANGFTGRAMFYSSEAQHRRKLEQFAGCYRQLGPIESLLDVGCGYGALLTTIETPAKYLGVDVVPELVVEARRRHPSHTFIVSDIESLDIEPFAWVFLVGVLSAVPAPGLLLARAASLAASGVVFDVTIGERLPSGFQDLNRWSLDDIEGLLPSRDWQLEVCDAGMPWVVVAAKRRRSSTEDWA